VREEVLNRGRAARLDVLVVWVPVLLGDGEDEAKSQSKIFAASGVTQFYDADRTASLAFKVLAVDTSPRLREKRLNARGIVWDSFFLTFDGIDLVACSDGPAPAGSRQDLTKKGGRFRSVADEGSYRAIGLLALRRDL